MSDQQHPSQCLFLCQRSPWIWLQLELAFLFHICSSGNCRPPLPSLDSGGLLLPSGSLLPQPECHTLGWGRGTRRTCLVSGVFRLPLEWVLILKTTHRSLWRRQWHPTPVLLPGKSMDGGAW